MPLWQIKNARYEFIRVCIRRKSWFMGLNKKMIAGLLAVSGVIAVVVLSLKSLEKLEQLDLSDPFEVDFDDE